MLCGTVGQRRSKDGYTPCRLWLVRQSPGLQKKRHGYHTSEGMRMGFSVLVNNGFCMWVYTWRWTYTWGEFSSTVGLPVGWVPGYHSVRLDSRLAFAWDLVEPLCPIFREDVVLMCLRRKNDY